MTTTRARTGRTAAETRRGARPQRPGRADAYYGAAVDGANALQIGYGDLAEEPLDYAPAPPLAPRRRPGVARPEPSPAVDPSPVAPPAPVGLPRAPFLVLVVTVVVVGVLGVLLLNTKINENAFLIDNLRSEQAALDQQEQQLQQALADRESTGNLAAAAARLGLVPAGTPAFLTLPNGQVVGVPQPAPATSTATAGR